LQLNYKKFGQGQSTLIVLHGFLGSLDNWQTLAVKFGDFGKVITIDQRNHGKSMHTDIHSIPLMVNDLKLFLDQHNLEKVYLMGHSMGGKVAMQFALDFPEKVEKLVIVDIAPRKYLRGHDDVFEAIYAIDLNNIQSRKEAEMAMESIMPDFGLRQFLLKNLERNETGAYQWKMNLPVLHNYYEEIIQEIGSNRKFLNPTLIIKGGKSKYISSKDEDDYLKLFPNYEMATITDAGHWVHAEQPELFFNEVAKFLYR
jgi:pimeloyl-ACP methyl ester carboxylesterase